MPIEAKPWRRLGEIVGTACVVATLALLSPGVRVVRAEDEALMSVDPELVAAAEGPVPSPSPTVVPSAPAAYPIVPASDVANASRPGVPGIEIQPGVVVLNTRGFNYGPPPTPLAPEALRQESAPR
jgi:hypothetical protein